MKLFKFFTNNIFVKLVALFLAGVTWFLVTNEIKKETVMSAKPDVEVLPSYGKMKSKKVFVKPILIGAPPEGYDIDRAAVQTDPESFVIAAPELIFKTLESVDTEPIDISKLKKTIIYEASIAPIAPSVNVQDLTVKVTIPIRKIEEIVPPAGQAAQPENK